MRQLVHLVQLVHLCTTGGPPLKDFVTFKQLHVHERAGRVNSEFFISVQTIGTDDGVLWFKSANNNNLTVILWHTLAKSLSRLIAEFHFVLIIMLINSALLVKGQIMTLLRTHTAAGFCSGCLKMPVPQNSKLFSVMLTPAIVRASLTPTR